MAYTKLLTQPKNNDKVAVIKIKLSIKEINCAE